MVCGSGPVACTSTLRPGLLGPRLLGLIGRTRPGLIRPTRPGIREQIAEDLEAFAGVARLLDKHSELSQRYEFEKMVDEFRTTLTAEDSSGTVSN